MIDNSGGEGIYENYKCRENNIFLEHFDPLSLFLYNLTSIIYNTSIL